MIKDYKKKNVGNKDTNSKRSSQREAIKYQMCHAMGLKINTDKKTFDTNKSKKIFDSTVTLVLFRIIETYINRNVKYDIT